MASIIKNKVFLITGGTGSFGHQMISKLVRMPVKRIICFSRDEKKQDDMKKEFAEFSSLIKYVIGDTKDYTSIYNALEGVDYVFHAAALKQVPSCEDNVFEAIKTNIIGSQNVMRAATERKVQKVVCLSTDKAVQPINAMGMTKALMEKLAFNQHSETQFVVTRYGNVMGSRGSVIPLFRKQLQENKCLTITDGNMTRFLMSLEEAINLVLSAFRHGIDNDLFIYKAPACTINDLAQAIIKESGLTDVEIKVIGNRGGEKMHETLITSEELLYQASEESPDFIIVNKKDATGVFSTPRPDFTSENTRRLTVDELVEILKEV